MTRKARTTVSYVGRAPARPAASRAAQGASRKRDTKPEVVLRKALWRRGLRGYRVGVSVLPGKPDVVFRRQRLAVFCDGDFWHGRDLAVRLAKLRRGHNAPYWTAKIRGNVERDRRHDAALRDAGWAVLRYWESDILADADAIAAQIHELLSSVGHKKLKSFDDAIGRRRGRAS